MESTSSSAPRAVSSVLLVETWPALGLANDLATAGLAVYVLNDGAYRARWMPRGVTLLPPAPIDLDKVVDSIGAAVQAVSPDIVLPVCEEALYRIWDEEPPWLPLVQPMVDPGLRAAYRSKHLLGAFARELGVLVPRTRLLMSDAPEELASVIDDLGLPVVVKGAGGCGGAQVKIVGSLAAACAAVAELHLQTGEFPALQEYLTGATYLVGGVFDRGRPVRLIAAEKIEMYPPRTGPAIFLTSRDEPELLDAAERVFRGLGHSGIASADFVRGRDGHFRFLEVNPRPWGSYGLARVLGIDLVGECCRMLRGEHLPSETGYPTGRSWAKMPDYLFASPMRLSNVVRRAVHPVAVRSWYWHAPRVLLYQARCACRSFRSTFLRR